MRVLFEGELLADYHQLYVADALNGLDELPQDWNDEILARRVNLGPGVIVVSTARNMPVPFRVELHESAPEIDLDAVDHAVECGIVTSGEIVVAGLMDYAPDAARASVPAGRLRALVVSIGLDTLSEDGLDGDDAYVVRLWPGAGDEVLVRKQWIDAPTG
ncbi:hypothetical protein IHQ68_18490 [Chelatococcus sambhunathii]|uniref:Uncharacterized protein n=1 Tax=Chelatococcus sambhunathii TaxID=363953 RepID=A0ABU1DKG3_9HYPH|nr:hypothetical protein [Chelatococcus sambhunathii]MDR4308613.1 hypothetical protein [Chelatococcus sambhunathii]